MLNLIRVRELKLLGKARVKLKLSVRRKCVCWSCTIWSRMEIILYSDVNGWRHYLWIWRGAPHSRTGFAPSELLLGRTIRTKLDLLKPNVDRETFVKQRQFLENRMKEVLDFPIGHEDLARNYRGKIILEKRRNPQMWRTFYVSNSNWTRGFLERTY